jgi:hypothetical protein
MNEEKTTLKPMQKNIFKLGSIAAILSMISIAFAIVAYYIWPYKGNTTSIEAILSVLSTDRIGALISLDVSMLIIFPITILTFLAIYYVLKRVDEPIAFFALLLNFTAFVLVIVCRPLVELVTLSNQFALATDAIEKAKILSAGEVLRIQLDGTAWAIQTAFFMIAGLINNILMLRSAYFKKKTAWTGIVISAIGLPFFIPEIGLFFLFLNTIGSIPWLFFVAHDLYKVSKTV